MNAKKAKKIRNLVEGVIGNRDTVATATVFERKKTILMEDGSEKTIPVKNSFTKVNKGFKEKYKQAKKEAKSVSGVPFDRE